MALPPNTNQQSEICTDDIQPKIVYNKSSSGWAGTLCAGFAGFLYYTIKLCSPSSDIIIQVGVPTLAAITCGGIVASASDSTECTGMNPYYIETE